MPSKLSRELCARDFALLNELVLVKKDVFHLSEAFLQAKSVDEPGYSPLTDVYFCQDANRYKSPQGDDKIHEDDFILQAMVVWNLYRLIQGWGRVKMLRQLSVWEGTDNKHGKCESSLDNLWDKEIKALQEDRKMSRRFCHYPENFDSFVRYYPQHRDTEEKWKRHSDTMKDTMNSVSHEFSEQATVQWALSIQSPHLVQFAADVVRLLHEGAQLIRAGAELNGAANDAAAALPNVLLDAANRADGDDKTFCNLAMEGIAAEENREAPGQPAARKRNTAEENRRAPGKPAARKRKRSNVGK